jgi:predicted Zn-dependent protease
VKFLKSFLGLFIFFGTMADNAHAVPLIRDAEIEHTLRVYADPIFRVNGLKPSAVKIFIVQDSSLNAFVAGGANLFIHTGMLLDCETPDMVLGVIAHESGHIVGGHLAQGSEKLKDAQMGSIMTFVLGAAAAAASGKPEAAAAVISGGQNSVMRNYLAFTRAHEESADQSALVALEKLHISASGMVKVFDLLRRHEREHGGSTDPYMMTHPLTGLRIQHVRDRAENAKTPMGQYPKEYDILHQRMIAKLYGFINSPERTLARYPMSNKSIGARVARALAYYKMPDMDRSMTEMDGLIAEFPKDPFFHELKGQILFENNRPEAALASYQTAVKLLPESPLLLADLAKVELAQTDKSLAASATAHLEKSVQLDDTNSTTWRQLAIAYGKSGNKGMSALSLAEEAILLDDPKRALGQVEQAFTMLSQGTPSYQRAKDIKARALDLQQEKEDEDSPF